MLTSDQVVLLPFGASTDFCVRLEEKKAWSQVKSMFVWNMKPLTLGAGQLWFHMFPWFISFPQFIYHLFSYIINTHFFHGKIWTHNWPAPNVSGFIAQLRGHGFKPRWSPEFFSGFFTQLHKLRSLGRSFLHFHKRTSLVNKSCQNKPIIGYTRIWYTGRGLC